MKKNSENKASFNWFPGHMNKSIKEIEQQIPVVDLVIEIVDARAPFSTENPLFRKLLSKRPRLIILSKGDLADPNVTKKWIEYFESKNDRTYLIKNKDINISKDIEKLILLMTKEKREHQKTRGIENPQLNVLVVGIPNVGKSTLIQKLSKSKIVKKGDKPGVTRGLQRIIMTQNITLIDTPGILPSKFETENIACTCAATNSIKLEVIPKERFATKIMRYLFNSYPDLIEMHYNFNFLKTRPIDFEDTFSIFEQIAKAKKMILIDNLYDTESAMELFIHDLHQGKFKNISFERPIEIAQTQDFEEELTDDFDFTSNGDKTIEW